MLSPLAENLSNSETILAIRSSVTVVIPAYNEGERILKVIDATAKYAENIIVVNDCSVDNTSAVSRSVNAIVVDLPVNSGAGYATRVGCDLALSKGAKIIVTIDADGQHNPDEIPKLVNVLLNENLDIVFGFRPRNNEMPFINKIGGTLLYKLSNFLFKVDIKDTQTGFHAFTSECYLKLRWTSNRYAFVSELVYRISESKLRYKEVTVQTIYNDKKGGMRKRDGIKSILLMLLWRFKTYHLIYKLLN